MGLKLCPVCRKPYLDTLEACPKCPAPRTFDPESAGSLGCIVLSILPLALLVIFWLLMFLGFFFR